MCQPPSLAPLRRRGGGGGTGRKLLLWVPGPPSLTARGPAGSSLPTFLKLLTVMAKPLVRGSRWCLRLGSPLAWATCMLIWCFFSVNRVPSQ